MFYFAIIRHANFMTKSPFRLHICCSLRQFIRVVICLRHIRVYTIKLLLSLLGEKSLRILSFEMINYLHIWIMSNCWLYPVKIKHISSKLNKISLWLGNLWLIGFVLLYCLKNNNNIV